MISEELFINRVFSQLNRDLTKNINQKEAILAPLDEDQFIVAGPGSGKTTVLVLKVLKYIFVDDIKPENIIVTTFTKKAAKELKERIFVWANKLIKSVDVELNHDFNKIVIGTLDSIAEEILLSDNSDMEIIDNFTSSAMMMQVLLTDERNKDKKLKQFFKKLKNNQGSFSTSDLNNQIQSIKERICYDMVDKSKLEQRADKDKLLYTILNDYEDKLKGRSVLDYASLEMSFYELLSSSTVPKLNNISVLLVDEYQDTNFLQEQIYFKLAEYVKNNHGNITVVGDDDQSLYRFRGATISLFTNYIERVNNQLSLNPKTIYLQINYRSTRNIINFSNEFLHLDKKYLSSRTTNKPLILPDENSKEGVPVFGMFRNNMAELSTDLSNLIYELKTSKLKSLTRNGITYDLSSRPNPSIAILTNSPKEETAFNKKRLPYYIRESLFYKDENLRVFNPRGQNIESTEIVSLICGLILITIDSKGVTESKLENIPPHTKKILKIWRKKAQQYVNTEEIELTPISNKLNLLDLVDGITQQLENLIHDSAENEIYSEIIVETITQTSNAITIDNLLSDKQIFWHILVPIATGAIDIDDDKFDVELRDNVNIMSIHQSKGLEFDIVIVDVGSDITNNLSSSSFRRFPKNGGLTYNMEKYLNEFSSMKKDYQESSGIDEAFNDLIRRYFVAFSRAKTILILVGLNNLRYGFKGDFQNIIEIPNIATGWARDKKWHWKNLDNLVHL